MVRVIYSIALQPRHKTVHDVKQLSDPNDWYYNMRAPTLKFLQIFHPVALCLNSLYRDKLQGHVRQASARPRAIAMKFTMLTLLH